MNLVEITRRYAEPHRRYHTLRHIAGMFDSAARFGIDLGVAQIFAIWFHDIVYDPTRTDNEERSASLVMSAMSAASYDDATHARRIILDTKTHKPSDPQSAIVLDLDMGILCASHVAYRKYVHDVREEFSHLSDKEWTAGRRAWIIRTLAEPIYHTAHYQGLPEKIARANLEAELRRVSGDGMKEGMCGV